MATAKFPFFATILIHNFEKYIFDPEHLEAYALLREGNTRIRCFYSHKRVPDDNGQKPLFPQRL